MTSRLAGFLKSATQQILVAAPPEDSRIDGYIGLERRLTLHLDEHVEITDLVVGRRPRTSTTSRSRACLLDPAGVVKPRLAILKPRAAYGVRLITIATTLRQPRRRQP